MLTAIRWKYYTYSSKMEEDGFDQNIYTWNGIISGLIENGHYELAMQVFSEMQSSKMGPDI